MKKLYIIKMFNTFGEFKGFFPEDGKISTQEFETMDLAHNYLKNHPEKLKSGYYYVPVETFKAVRD